MQILGASNETERKQVDYKMKKEPQRKGALKINIQM